MEFDIPKTTLISWNVRCINKKTKELFDRELILDWPSLTAQETKDILGIIEQSIYSSKILKYRNNFKQVSSDFYKDASTYFTSFKSIYVEGYFEDETGKGLDEIELIKHLSGLQVPVILSNVKSILQLGTSSLKGKENWAQKDSDTIAHFLQVNNQIAKSRWLREKCIITIQGGKSISEVPSFESLIYVTVYFRQLYSQRDKLFRSACDTYIQFVDNKIKQTWVKHEKDCFLKTLEAVLMPFRIDGISNQDLLEAFLYGALVLHSNLSVKFSKRKLFRELLEGMNRDKLVFSLNSCLKQLYQPVAKVAPVIYQDLSHWQHNHGIPPPDIQWLSRIFGGNSGQ